MPLLVVATLVAGLLLLVLGADWLVRGASRIASASGVSSLVIGLTIVAYGTSAPELAVSVQSAWSGQSDLALGNVVGSNIFNVLLILGISALITPLAVAAQVIRVEVPIMVALSCLTYLLALDGGIGRVDGLALSAGAVVYTVLQIRQSRKDASREPSDRNAAGARRRSSRVGDVAWIVAGLCALVAGSRWLVSSAVTIATTLGVSDLVIGLTIVAAGTSLPEVATSIVAAMRGERDIAVGNVVGSNIFNILSVLGFSSLLSPAGLPVAHGALTFDIPVMIAVSVICLPIFASGAGIERWEGGLFLFYYVAYTTYVVLAAQGHDTVPTAGDAVRWFVMPVTAATVVVAMWQAAISRPAPRG